MADNRDEYRNPVRQTDEYDVPVNYPEGTTGSYGTTEGHGATGAGYGAQATATGEWGGYDIGYGRQEQQHHHHGLSGMLHRSGSSSSSSSSEDDGQGGRRRRKGIKEKIKEKLPGAGHKETHSHPHSTGGASTTPVTEAYTEHQQKKGIMEKIKEKLPGHHNP